MVFIRTYVDALVRDLKDYHDSESRSLRSEISELRQAILVTETELQRQVTELHDSSSKYLTDRDYAQQHQILVDRISAVERQIANYLGRGIGLAVVGGIFVAVIAAFITHLLSG